MSTLFKMFSCLCSHVHLLPREGYLRSTIVAVKTLERTLKLSFYFEKTKIRNLRRKSDSFLSPEAQETVHGGGVGFRQSYLSGGSQVLGYFVGEYVQFVLVIIGHAESVHYLFTVYALPDALKRRTIASSRSRLSRKPSCTSRR